MGTEISGSFNLKIRRQADGYTVEAAGPDDIRVEPQLLAPPSVWLTPEHVATLQALAGQGSHVSAADIEALGRALYRVLFTAPVATAFGLALGSAQEGGGIRLCLEIEPPELAALPWEAMHDGQDWLATRSALPLVRRLPYLAGVEPSPTLQVRGPLRILFAGASPEDLPALDVASVATEIRSLLQEAVDRRQVVFDLLLNVTLEELQEALFRIEAARLVVPDLALPAVGEERAYFEALGRRGVRLGPILCRLEDVWATTREGGFELLHFATHGQFDPADADRSPIYLENDERLYPRDLSGSQAWGLRRSQPLVFLNACYSAQTGFVLTGLGGWVPRFIHDARASAFAGGLWQVNDRLAAAFARRFYDNLWQGTTLGQAFQEARLDIRASRPANSTWLAYALYGDPSARVYWGR